MWLETELRKLDPKTNVIVMLSSASVYGIGETDKPVPMIDGCGNHYAANWLAAIEQNNLYEKFNMMSIVRDKDQITIYLENKKSDPNTQILDHTSNQCAIDQVYKTYM